MAKLPAFTHRHVGPSEPEVAQMLQTLGLSSVEELLRQAVPDAIRTERPLVLPEPLSEAAALERLAELADQNEVWRSYLGMGYHGTHMPTVIQRNVLEDPAWYTAYTPYQAEISQGRMEVLLVYQTVVQELCGFEIANASLLDEATAAAEAMTMSHRIYKGEGMAFFVSERCHPQTLAVLQTRAEPLGIEIIVGDHASFDPTGRGVFGAMLQYPATDGGIEDYSAFIERMHEAGVLVTMATDLLALTVLKSPGQMGADIAIGSSQRFGVPMGLGGPHAAFIATHEKHKRQLPGRIIGVSKDVHGAPALRMALQTREQHIRRQRATSNICTAQVLLAVIAGLYAVWHGPEGLVAIAERVADQARRLAEGLRRAGHRVVHAEFFDTICVDVGDRAEAVLSAAAARRINLRQLGGSTLCVALDETVREADLADLLEIFGSADRPDSLAGGELPSALRRTDAFLTAPVFRAHRSETEMLRYLHRLSSRDLALNTSMIPLGSCTMKLNATTEMMPITWQGFSALHPFVPAEQRRGYDRLFADLEAWLAELTGTAAVSLQPNAGSQGEYAGLLAIRSYHRSRGEGETRTVCLIPTSAHGTNPASAVMAGMKVVPVDCDDQGNIDVADLRAKAERHADSLAALMVTYPSTHGVFEESIREICEIVHQYGGQVYLDGANMNAMVGLVRPGELGADVLHLNLHKTFCIPHGGGGPGMGPICAAAHLAPHLPGHPVVSLQGPSGENAPVSAGPWGSASILPITWAYIAMLGAEGLTRATEIAILNANYIATRLEEHYPVLYRGSQGRVAHECILDCRGFRDAGVVVDDLAKRLMDFGFHAPTMSFPVVGTLMVEPTESESKAEIDRFCEAMIAIRDEIRAVEEGEIAHADSPLAHAPHTAREATAETWERAYSRSQAVWPAPWLLQHKYWPPVGRVDNAWGDRNLICTCDAWPETGTEGFTPELP